MFHSVGRIMRWAGAYRKRMVLGFVCSFFATWCTAGPVVLAAWALGQLIVDAWGEERLSPHLPWLCLGGIVVLILLRFFFTYWKNRLQESIGTERAAEQRMELGNVLKRVSLGYFAKNDLGDILAALTTELSTLELQSMKMVDAVVNGYGGPDAGEDRADDRPPAQDGAGRGPDPGGGPGPRRPKGYPRRTDPAGGHLPGFRLRADGVQPLDTLSV